MGVDRVAPARLTDDAPQRAGVHADVLAVFAVLWAFANLFHVWGPSGRATAVFDDVTTVAVTHVVVGLLAVAVLVRPRSTAWLTALAVAGPVSFWFEAPVVGSHWALVCLVDLGILVAIVWTKGHDRVALERRFVPFARVALLGFYSFAAFSKLNSAFFTPRVSCGNYYFDELAGSLHVTVHSATAGWWAHLVPIGTAGVELSVPVLLLFPVTRRFGVVLGLVFHSLIALDQSHLFSDFSSVLTALFTLFLPAAFASDVVARWRSLTDQARESVRTVVVVGALALLGVQWYGHGKGLYRVFLDGRMWAWLLLDALVLVLVVHHLVATRTRRIDVPLRPQRWLWIVVALVVFNGAAPYLELRTAYAFNMYANLVTAGGDSNHFIVRRTLPLTDDQRDLVAIVSSSDPGLEAYATSKFDIPFLQLRDYLSHHRDVAVTYRRHGEVRTVAHAADDPALVEPVPSWESKLFAFRSLDELDPPRCQPAFLPAL